MNTTARRIEQLNISVQEALRATKSSNIYSLHATEPERALHKKISRLTQEKKVLLTRPLRSEVEQLTQQLKTISAEREALALHLATTEELYQYSKEKCEALAKSCKESQEVYTTQKAQMEEERASTCLIITAQRRRSSEREKELIQVQRSVAEMKLELQKMNLIIQESTQQYRELSKRYHALETEKEQLRSVLYGDQDLMNIKQQCFELKQELRKIYVALKADRSEEIQRKYLQVRSSLAETTKELKESQLVSQRLTTLLKQARHALSLKDSSELTYSEATLLEESLGHHLSQQSNRRNTRELMISNIKNIQQQDESFLCALQLTDSQRLNLCQNQLALTPEYSLLTTKEQDIKIFESLGRAAYLNGRFLAAQEFFESNLTRAPDYIPSILHLGVTLLRQNKMDAAIHTFNQAITASGSTSLPYAHQMLGYIYYKKGLLEAARRSLRRCVKMSPKNAIAYNFLGMIAGDQQRLSRSKECFKNAIRFDPTLSEPEYNLALILSHQGSLKNAKAHYNNALKKGAKPDIELEKRL